MVDGLADDLGFTQAAFTDNIPKFFLLILCNSNEFWDFPGSHNAPHKIII